MAYSVQANLESAIGSLSLAQLTDDVGGITINAAHVTDAITKADRYIDLHLRGTHTVPFTTTPEPIGQISVDLAVRYVYERRPNTEATESLKDRWTRAEKLLEKIARGIIKIDDSTSFRNTASIWDTGVTTDNTVYTDDYFDKF